MKVLFRRFAEDNIDFLARYLRRLGIPMAEIDDAIQEVLWVLHQKRAEVEHNKERAFLVAVATRVTSGPSIMRPAGTATRVLLARSQDAQSG